MGEEGKNLIYLFVNIVFAALTLGAIVYMLDIKSDYADDRYDQLYAKERAQMRREFATYDDNDELKGIEVVALIRNEYDNNSIDIYVTSDKYGNSFLLDGVTRGLDTSTSSNRMQISQSFNPSRVNYVTTTEVQMLRNNNYMFTSAVLRTLFNDTDIYKSKLIYDGAPVQDGIQNKGTDSIVTGIYIYR